MSANTYADASTTGEMRFNPKWFGPTGQLDTMRNPHTTDYGWKVEIPNAAVDGISKARSTTTHEFGHMIDNVAKARLGRPEPHYAELMQIILDVVEPNLKGRHTAGAARLIQDKWGRQIALNARIKALVSRELSEYGATNLHEVVAESTSEALNSSSPRPLAKAVYEWVRARAEGAR
jgi:hypothetical protein